MARYKIPGISIYAYFDNFIILFQLREVYRAIQKRKTLLLHFIEECIHITSFASLSVLIR